MEVWGGNTRTDSAVAMPGLDAWVYAVPYAGSKEGGDVHYLSSCATGRITRLLVADVSGHGDEVAAVASTLRSLMRKNVNYMEQDRFVRALNTEFTGLSESSRFATAIVATYWEPTRYLVLCNAGHPRPVWYSARARQWRILEQSRDLASEGLANIPLGIAEPTAYDQFGITLRPGDLVLMYTDWLTETLKSDSSTRLGEQGLLDILATLDTTDPRRVVSELMSSIHAYSGGAAPDDDVTVLLLSPNSVPARRSIGNLLVMARKLLQEATTSWGRVAWPQPRLENIAGALMDRFSRRYRNPADAGKPDRGR